MRMREADDFPMMEEIRSEEVIRILLLNNGYKKTKKFKLNLVVLKFGEKDCIARLAQSVER